MWGHADSCPCSVCKSLPRIFQLIASGGGHLTFVHWVGDRLRVLEAECRDELQRLESTSGVLGPVQRAPGKGEEGTTATVPPPKGETKEPQQILQTTPKVKPPAPPRELVEPKETAAQPVKEELPRSPPGGHRGVVEVENTGASSSRPSRPPRSHPSRSRRHSRGSRRERSRRRSRDREAKTKRRSRSRSRRGRSKSRRTPVRGRSKKKRSERPPEPDHPPPSHLGYTGGRPPEPRHPPPGRGWVGPVPRSDHARWSSGTNKGVVKRAKQERFNNRRRKRR